jgi:ferredoxin
MIVKKKCGLSGCIGQTQKIGEPDHKFDRAMRGWYRLLTCLNFDPEGAMQIPNIDYSLCQGCGGCSDAYPELFEFRGERAWVIAGQPYDADRHKDLMTVCPYYAISIVDV